MRYNFLKVSHISMDSYVYAGEMVFSFTDGTMSRLDSLGDVLRVANDLPAFI